MMPASTSLPCAETHHTHFVQLTILPNPPKILCFTMLCSWPDTPKSALSHVVICTPSSTRFLLPGSIQLSIINCISVQPFLHSLQQRVPILYNGPPQNCSWTWGNWTSSLGQPESTFRTASRLVEPLLQGSQS